MSNFPEGTPGTADGRYNRSLERPRSKPVEDSVMFRMEFEKARILSFPQLLDAVQTRQKTLLDDTRTLLLNENSDLDLSVLRTDYMQICSLVDQTYKRADLDNRSISKPDKEKMQDFFNKMDIFYYTFETDGKQFMWVNDQENATEQFAQVQSIARRLVGVPMPEQNKGVFIESLFRVPEKRIVSLRQQIVWFIAGDSNAEPLPENFLSIAHTELQQSIGELESIKLRDDVNEYISRIENNEKQIVILDVLAAQDFNRLLELSNDNREFVNDMLASLINRCESVFGQNVFLGRADDERIRKGSKAIVVMADMIDLIQRTDIEEMYSKRMKNKVRSVVHDTKLLPENFPLRLQSIDSSLAESFVSSILRIQDSPYAVM